MDPSRYSLALDEARRALDQQAVDASGIRTRMTNLIGVGGLAAAFIGGLALRDEAATSAWTILGAVAFALLIVVTAVALLPRKFKTTQDAQVLVGWVDDEPDADPADLQRDLAIHMSRQYDANTPHLYRLVWLYAGGVAFLLLEIVFLLLDLRGR